MSKILIIYGTTQGQTAKIAHRIEDVLSSEGNSVDLFDIEKISDSVFLKKYDSVIIGASVHVGGYQRHLKKWVKSHSQELNSMSSAFFSVCLGVLQKETVVKTELAKIIEDFMTSTGWQPKTKVIFAGALEYSKYNFLVKWWMKRIAKKSGTDTDTSKDYEYTDWNAVSEFAQRFSKKQMDHPSQKKIEIGAHHKLNTFSVVP